MSVPTPPAGALPRVVRTRDALREALAAPAGAAVDAPAGAAPSGSERSAAAGSAATRAVVMTMGALHDGHLQLVRAARERVGPTGQVVVTVFVNPLQFGPGEDLDRYPRDLDADLALLAGLPEPVPGRSAVDLVFAPSVEEMYPGGDPIVRVTSGRIGTVLEGAFRPGHFDGVLTVVLKLLHLTRPDVAFYGEKDAQQLLAIRRMVADLDVDVEVVGVPIVRDDDGLALSSRNAYLSETERSDALTLSRALRAGAAAAAAGRGAAAAIEVASGMLNEHPGVVVDYLALVDPTTVDDLEPEYVGPALLLVAARVGTTRLIDNLAVDVADPAASTARPGGTQ
ncbi:pantoate--beta-alanine ligase [Oerskovia paurometabola]|uniref:pantoate--beta-alanine ligase n=1 Tax=Oerskovia paurometabola TaxID=162170 RepID=UPI0019577182|nr:pantoate--beta-alanine ligase [Oerskovia paurometabola]MBM7498681.1 pantoate--beta-alanine ligase [Oerskovia paurometabola]